MTQKRKLGEEGYLDFCGFFQICGNEECGQREICVIAITRSSFDLYAIIMDH